MDFVNGPPEIEEYNSILAIVDRLSKMRHLIPYDTTVGVEPPTALYVRRVWTLHGLPKHISSACGTQFNARFWKFLCHQLRIEARISTAYYPEIDGQTERFNTEMKQYLRCYVSSRQDHWASWLPMA